MSEKGTDAIVAQAELRQGLHIASANPSDNPHDNHSEASTLNSSSLTQKDPKPSPSPVGDQMATVNGSRMSEQRKGGRGGGDAGVGDPSVGHESFEGYRKRSCCKRYGESMKKFLPIRCASPKGKEMPIHVSGMLSLFTFSWITKFMWRTFRKGFLAEETLWDCPSEESAEVNGQRFARLWAEELKRKNGLEKASLGWVLFRFIRTMCIVGIILNLISTTLLFIVPALLFRLILDYARSEETNLAYGLSLTACLCAIEVGRSLTQLSFIFFGYLLGMRVRSAMMHLIFHKNLRLRSMSNTSVGEVVNFFANDCQRLLEVSAILPMALAGPLSAVVGTIYCVLYIGPWALLGALVILLYFPYQALISKLTTYVRRRTIVVTDKRVRMINEILTSIKLIKLYAWEKSFAKAVAAVRAKEKRLLQFAAYLQTMSIAVNPMVPVFASVCTFMGHILAGNDLSASQAFVIVAVYNMTKMRVAVIPRLVRLWSEAVVGLRRAKDFLAMEEMDEERFRKRPLLPGSAVELSESTFAWDVVVPKAGLRKKEERKRNRKRAKNTRKSEIGGGGGEQEMVPMKELEHMQNGVVAGTGSKFVEVLFDISLTVPKGSLCGICGRVGSGKSSLLSALLGQMHQSSGGFAADGRFCYVPQQAWILNATVCENILFGLPYDKERYEAVLRQCHLTYDLKWLPSGDKTEIGERGINLSGGQKQRVSLARAMYSDRDIYLLDDPLSAVDPQVGGHLFEHCLLKLIANHKTVIFVTHQLQYLSKCDKIILMKDGRIFEQGTHESLMSTDGEYANLINAFYSEQEKEKSKTTKEAMGDLGNKGTIVLGSTTSVDSGKSLYTSQNSLQAQTDGKLVQAEVKERGAVTWNTYRTYFKAAGGYCASGMAILSFVFPVLCSSFCNYWLSFWIAQGSGSYDYGLNETFMDNSSNVTEVAPPSNQISDNPDLNMYITVYGLSSVAVVITLCIRGFLFTMVTLKASSTMHDMAFSRLLRSPMTYFDVTPVGRMLNRFSKDLDDIDVRLPFNAEEFIQNACLVLSSIIMICIIFPWYLIAAIPLVAVFWFLQSIARVVVREVKRVDNVTRSPIFSLVATSVQGLHTIHAYNKENDFLTRFKDLLDKNTVATMHYFFAGRWLAIRLDLLTIFTTTFTALMVVLTKGLLPPSYAGLALVYAAQMTGMFQYTIRLISEVESRFTSVERMHYYLKEVVEEAPWVIPDQRPPATWPHKGAVSYVEYSMRYRQRLPLVLRGVSCEIKPTENVGIVGRTGSGKSSLVSALFRLTEPETGKIIIDDVDISTIGLTDLRSKLSIIPQDPLLFAGTIRYNLDPFQERDDAELWQALDKCYMKSMVAGLPQSLDASVVENGENFSVGERQLLCMARAILRNSRILVLDEATAAVDTEMDARIQRTIVEAFSGCTILTIAHRLNTVLHCDRVMVLDKGQIVEFDNPQVLLQNPSSKFSQMVRLHI